MELIADIFLIAGALAAAFYCIVLSRRLSRFNDLEKGVGGAIAVLSAQVDDMTKALSSAQGTAQGSTEALEGLTDRAEAVAKRLELLVASMHDLPVEGTAPAAPPPKPPEPDRGAVAKGDGSEPGEEVSLFRTHRGYRQEAAE